MFLLFLLTKVSTCTYCINTHVSSLNLFVNFHFKTIKSPLYPPVVSQPSLTKFPSIQTQVRQEDSPEPIPFDIEVELEQHLH